VFPGEGGLPESRGSIVLRALVRWVTWAIPATDGAGPCPWVLREGSQCRDEAELC